MNAARQEAWDADRGWHSLPYLNGRLLASGALDEEEKHFDAHPRVSALPFARSGMRLGMQRLLSQLARYREGHERNGNRSHASPPVQKEKKSREEAGLLDGGDRESVDDLAAESRRNPAARLVRDGLEQM